MGLEPRHPGVSEGAQCQGVLHHDVLDARRPQAAPQLRQLGDVEPREVRDVHGGSATQAIRQCRHHLLLLRLGPDHANTAGSRRTPGPIVLDTVTDRM